MAQEYSSLDRENDPMALPDIEVFERAARECALDDGDVVHEFMQRREFRLASMNSCVLDAMIDAIIEEYGVRGGWFYWCCFPGCLPDGDPIGPFNSYVDALAAARQEAGE